MRICVFFILMLQVFSLKTNMKPLCRDCKFLIGDTLECKKFNNVDLVTGEITNNYAIIMRKHGDCGEDAIYFEKNDLKIITVPYYFIKKYSWSLVTIGLTFVYCLVSLQIKR